LRLVLPSLFQENISQLSIREKLRLRTGFTRSFSEPFAQGLFLPYSSSHLTHLFRNALQLRAFPSPNRISNAGTPGSSAR